MTPDELKTPAGFKAGRNKLGLSHAQLGEILNTDARTIRKWEAAEGGANARPPNPIAARVLEWMLNGWRPPQWPAPRD